MAQAEPAPAYRTARVEEGPLVSSITATGALSALVTVEVGSQLSGQIAELYADFNRQVREGQVLARLNGDQIDARLAQARADREAAKATLNQQVAQLDRARAEVANARANAANAAAQILRSDLALKDAEQEDDFWMRDLSEVAATRDASSRALSFLLAAVAAVSLLVGGIGIMNIMLVSVTERTREIGLRLAVGAPRRDILMQFLIESTTLSIIGAGIGVVDGVGTAVVVAQFAGWPTLIQMDAVVLAVVVSGLVEVFFGLYPARRASLLNPIDALRHE
nr:FtsX-like permease family protein [Azospirillum rugosum]